jgi:hypothetical protein
MLENYKIKKEKPLTDEEKQRIDTFVKAASCLGFSISTKSKNGCKCKTRGGSDTLSYNVKSDKVGYDNRRKKGLFDGFFEGQKYGRKAAPINQNYFEKDWGFIVPQGLKVRGYSIEDRLDEDNHGVQEEVWFIGELQ